MGVLFTVLPLFLMGASAWAVVGVRGPPAGQPFTLASATSVYARVLVVGGAIMALVGGAEGIKVAFAFLNLGYSYTPTTNVYKPAPGAPPAGYLEHLPDA